MTELAFIAGAAIGLAAGYLTFRRRLQFLQACYDDVVKQNQRLRDIDVDDDRRET